DDYTVESRRFSGLAEGHHRHSHSSALVPPILITPGVVDPGTIHDTRPRLAVRPTSNAVCCHEASPQGGAGPDRVHCALGPVAAAGRTLGHSAVVGVPACVAVGL